MKIEIFMKRTGAFGVRYGNRYDNHLSFDEALGEVVRLMSHKPPRYLRFKSGWKLWRAKIKKGLK